MNIFVLFVFLGQFGVAPNYISHAFQKSRVGVLPKVMKVLDKTNVHCLIYSSC